MWVRAPIYEAIGVDMALMHLSDLAFMAGQTQLTGLGRSTGSEGKQAMKVKRRRRVYRLSSLESSSWRGFVFIIA